MKGDWAWTTMLALTVILSNNIIEFLGNLGVTNPQANLVIIAFLCLMVIKKNKIVQKLGKLM